MAGALRRRLAGPLRHHEPAPPGANEPRGRLRSRRRGIGRRRRACGDDFPLRLSRPRPGQRVGPAAAALRALRHGGHLDGRLFLRLSRESPCPGHPAWAGDVRVRVHRLSHRFGARATLVRRARCRPRTQPVAAPASGACAGLFGAARSHAPDRLRPGGRRLCRRRAARHRHAQRRHAQPVAGQPELGGRGCRLGRADRPLGAAGRRSGPGPAPRS